MSVHNWVPHPPTQKPSCEYIKYCHSDRLQSITETPLHNRSVCVCAALMFKDGKGRQKPSGRGRDGGRRGSYIARKKLFTSVHECTFIQDNSRVPSGEKTQLSSKHQRIVVMIKTHNIRSNSKPHCFNNNKKKKLKQNKKSIICAPNPIIHRLMTPSRKRMPWQIKVFKTTICNIFFFCYTHIQCHRISV